MMPPAARRLPLTVVATMAAALVSLAACHHVPAPAAGARPDAPQGSDARSDAAGAPPDAAPAGTPLPPVDSGLDVAPGADAPLDASGPTPGRIAVRTSGSSGRAEFYDVATGAAFLPIGNNYTRLNVFTAYHDFLMTGVYDAARTEAALRAMASNGYNVVRFFLPTITDAKLAAQGVLGLGGPPTTASLYAPCVDNLIDFLRRARAHGLRVIPTLDWVPNNDHYTAIITGGSAPNVGGTNAVYLSPGGLAAWAAFFTDLVSTLKQRDRTLLPVVLAYSLQNEIAVTNDQAPFAALAGTVKTADGLTYDMADSVSRQQCADANIVNWANSGAAAIRAVDSEALVTAGMYTFGAVGKAGPGGLLPLDVPDHRFPARPATLQQWSTLSFLDLHTYPTGAAYSLVGDVGTSEFSAMNLAAKPVVMGEYGAFKSVSATPQQAALLLCAHRSALLSLGFSGALLWTWDTTEQLDLWTAVDDSGAINGVLAPIVGTCN